MRAERLITLKGHPEGRYPPGHRTSGREAGPGLRRDDDLFCTSIATKRGRPRSGTLFPVTWLLLMVSIIFLATPAHAVQPNEMLADPALEARARDIGRELRCLVCRNQSIDDSDADLAHDLRVLVRERLKEGDTNDQVIAYVRSRYGDFVLLRPPFAVGTVLLWVGPLLILLLGAFGVARFYRARARASGPAAVALSPEERRRLQAVLGEET
jgi:cytochrome c-type biogenesis protein CcmH